MLKFIPYDKNLVSRARELRKETTEFERILWRILQKERLLDLKFTRQKPIDRFILDFYCSSLRLAIEVDGNIHDSKRDRERDFILGQKFGIRVLRYKNKEVLNNIEKVKKDLVSKIGSLP